MSKKGIPVSDSEFVDNGYRQVTVPKTWVCTSKCAGKGCVSKLSADPKRVALQDVMSYQNPDVVARIAHDIGCSLTTADSIFTDVKKFLWMGSQSPHEDLIPTPTIDEGWHAFILYTQDYADFCDKYFGTFVHHTAHRVGEPVSQRVELIPTIDRMHDVFGGLPSANWHYRSLADTLAMVSNC